MEMLRGIGALEEAFQSYQESLIAKITAQSDESREQFRAIMATLPAKTALALRPRSTARYSALFLTRKFQRSTNRRKTYLADGIVNMARATHDLVLEIRRNQPPRDQFQRISDEFDDLMFEGDLCRLEGNLNKSVSVL